MSAIQNTPKVIGEKKLELNLAVSGHKEHIVAIGKALSSPVRIDIMNLIKTKPLSLQEISRLLQIPLSSTAMHIRCLEDAGLSAVPCGSVCAISFPSIWKHMTLTLIPPTTLFYMICPSAAITILMSAPPAVWPVSMGSLTALTTRSPFIPQNAAARSSSGSTMDFWNTVSRTRSTAC